MKAQPPDGTPCACGLTPLRGGGVIFGLALPVLRRLPAVRDMLPIFPVFRAELANLSAP
jgi:hypothetical protein